MKNAFALFVAAVVVLSAIPALAADGNVPQATLSSLGLGSMQVVSDAQGMQVRGMSSRSFTEATSLSIVQGIFFDPGTGSKVDFHLADFARSYQSSSHDHRRSKAYAETGLLFDGLRMRLGDTCFRVSSLLAGGTAATFPTNGGGD